MTQKKSELQLLLEKNAYGEGLTNEESLRALTLISEAEPSDQSCWVCSMHEKDDSLPENRAIYDTGLCKGHAHYALTTGK